MGKMAPSLWVAAKIRPYFLLALDGGPATAFGLGFVRPDFHSQRCLSVYVDPSWYAVAAEYPLHWERTAVERKARRIQLMQNHAFRQASSGDFHSSPPLNYLNIDPCQLETNFDHNPFPFTHNFSELDIFSHDYLTELADHYSRARRDFFVAGGAVAAGTDFYSVPHGQFSPVDALGLLHSRSVRVLLKRPENHDPGFRVLLDSLFGQLVETRPQLAQEEIVRLEGAILITSASTITPLHFDPEVGFFSQIRGQKIYHVYSPHDTTEPELERFYIGGVVDIATIDIKKRNPSNEHVYRLAPGSGFHQPQNAPHWVETGDGESVSYTFVFETKRSRARGRTRAFNYYQRKFGLSPGLPGQHPRRDASKAVAMRAVIPVRQFTSNTLRRLQTS
jgi:hypothetical protein